MPVATKRPVDLVDEASTNPLKKARLTPDGDDYSTDSYRQDNTDVEVDEDDGVQRNERPAGTDGRKIFYCNEPECNVTFDRPSKLAVHKASHSDERPFACEVEGCKKSFKRKENLTRHIRDAHTLENATECTWVVINDQGNKVPCGKKFPNRGKLLRHIDVHKAKLQFMCPEEDCGKSFRKQATLDAHVSADHRGECAHICRSVVVDDDGNEFECGKEYGTSAALKRHETRDHFGYTCSICAMDDDDLQSSFSTVNEERLPEGTLMTYAELKVHLRRAHPPICPTCGKQLKSVKGYNIHMKEHEQGIDPEQAKWKHACDWPGCGKVFAHTGNLATHKRNVHEKVRLFVCGEFDMAENPKLAGWNGVGCGASLGTKASLEKHIRSKHLGIPNPKWKPKTKIKGEENESESMSTAMDIPEAPTPDETNTDAIAMLTGHGYELVKRIACLVEGCPFRFSHNHDLVSHVELTHEWNIDDINDAIFEREALNGGDFWLGGIDPDLDERRKHADALRSQFEDRLRIGQIADAAIDPRLGPKSLASAGVQVFAEEDPAIQSEMV